MNPDDLSLIPIKFYCPICGSKLTAYHLPERNSSQDIVYCDCHRRLETNFVRNEDGCWKVISVLIKEGRNS